MQAIKLEEKSIPHILACCSCVVGLHPDGASDAIVDFALEYNKPFAILPCCTFSKQIRRHFDDGRPVRTYDDHLDWLQAKDKGIKRLELGFVGRNIVLFRNHKCAV